jgi:hypothetical protein
MMENWASPSRAMAWQGKARRLAMARLNVNDARCEALFASGLQRSEAPAAGAVAQAISCTVRRLGTRGCASQMAQEFGDHPEAAMDRMRWVRQVIGARQGPIRSVHAL